MRGPKDVERLRRYWDKHSRSYDKQMGFLDRKVFGDSRQWVCGQAIGDVLEVGVGTGLLQRVLEVVSIPTGGEHFRRRPVLHVRDQGFLVEQQERFKLGIVERVVARKPGLRQ